MSIYEYSYMIVTCYFEWSYKFSYEYSYEFSCACSYEYLYQNSYDHSNEERRKTLPILQDALWGFSA